MYVPYVWNEMSLCLISLHFPDRPRSILSNSSHGSRRSQQRTRQAPSPITPLKPKQKQNVSFSSKSDLSEEEDVTPKPTPNQSFNESKELFSSDENTPREEVRPMVEKLDLQKPATVSRREEVVRPPTPGMIGDRSLCSQS